MKKKIDLITEQRGAALKLAGKIKKVSEKGSAQQLMMLEGLYARLMDEAKALFELEEELLKEVQYEYLRAHKHLHSHFLRRLSDYLARLESREHVGREITDYMVNWLNNHFSTEDMDYLTPLMEQVGHTEITPSEKVSLVGKMMDSVDKHFRMTQKASV